ncbi:MAG: hypothetical protein M3Q33_08250 [Acidobacteriota bacterium]|nr:hypothetical protein [Acidobacteriota bacterium]
MLAKIKAKKLALIVVALLVTTFGIIASITVWSQSQQQKEPNTKEPAGQLPSRIIASRDKKMPRLTASGTDMKASVLEFVKFAGNSGADQREAIRKELTTARNNKQVIEVFCAESFRAQKSDHSQALLVLSLLGEIRSPLSAECLNRFLKLPFPKTGTVVDGEIIEQTALATLQAKAIDGLAYLNTKESNEIVLDAVKNHPSIIVRAEAIEAYMWNNRNNLQVARRTLSQYVRKGEEIYLDRVRRESGESAASFNRKLEGFLKAHPEVIAPKPEYEKEKEKIKDEKPVRLEGPPKF